MLFYRLIVLCFVTINQVSSDEYRKVLPQYRKSFSIYGKSKIRALYKALEPAIISFFKVKHLTKEYFLYSIRQRDPWTQSVLKGRFYRMDPNKDGVMNEKDLNGYFRFVVLSDMLVGGADANNDYTVTKKEFQQHVARLNPSQDKTLQVSFDIMFKDVDSNQDQLFNTNDFSACK